MQTGTLFSGVGHAGLILWVLLGDWLFTPQDTAVIAVTQVSLVTSSEFDAMQAAVEAPTPPQPAATPVETPPDTVTPPEPLTPDVVEPAPEPQPVAEPDPAPEPDPVPEPPQPIDVPDPIAPIADDEQTLETASNVVQPEARPADRVAPDPTPTPEPEAETADTPTPATSDTPTDAPVVPEDTVETVAPETGDVLRTEATEDQPETLGMQTSLRPRSRPAPRPVEDVAAVEPEPQPEAAPAPDPVEDIPVEDDVAAAIAAAVNEAGADTSATEPAAAPGGGDPLSEGEIGDFSRAVGSKWNLGSASTDALRTTIVIRVTFGPDAIPTGFELVDSDGPTEAATQTAFEAGRRAVQRAALQGGLPLPPEKYDTWKVLELVFDPNGMRMR